MLSNADEPIPEIPPDPKPKTLGEALHLLYTLYPFTDEEAADWLRDIEEVRAAIELPEKLDPWES